MMMMSLSPELTQTVLARLGVAAGPPTLALLDRLVNAYVRTVPWETAFRVVRRGGTPETNACPRWPDTFWRDNRERGGGGTCFESNYAFFSLLRALGYEGYLTINNMGETIGCHTAVILQVNGAKWLVDMGYPLYAPLPIRPHTITHQSTPFMHYTVIPDGNGVYQIEQHPHPKPNAFTLIDRPVTDAAYRAATTADYGPNGFFLDRLVINKVVNEVLWRFNSDETPWALNRFEGGVREDVVLDGDVGTAVARHFCMDEAVVQAALQEIKRDA